MMKIIRTESFRYIVCGILTTFLSILLFYICGTILNLDYIISNTISNIVSILFAFVVNKIYVFRSKTNTFKQFIKEFTKFTSIRFLLFIGENFMLIFLIETMFLNDNLCKIIATFIIVVTNYLVSKLFVFKK